MFQRHGRALPAGPSIPPEAAPDHAARLPPFEGPVPPDQVSVAERSLDDELLTWKVQRRRAWLMRVPWRPLSLMASLCFGVGAFVLPDSVNDAAQWLLLVLMGASLGAGIAIRRRQLAD